MPLRGVVVAERIEDSTDKPGDNRLGEIGLHIIKVADAVGEFGSPEAIFDVADGISSELGEVVWDVLCGGQDSKVYESAFGCANLLLIDKINIAPSTGNSESAGAWWRLSAERSTTAS